MAVVQHRSRLLERDRELTLLRRAWQEAQAGRGSTWLICAEAGGGKTSLLRAAAADAGRVLWGAAEPISPPEPFLAVATALPGFEPAGSRAESVRRAVTLLDASADGGPLTLVLDDLHFADEGTVAVLVRLASLGAGRPWLILTAFRPGEGSPALTLAATELTAQRQARRLDLAPLSRDAIAALLAGTRGRTPAAAEVEAIVRESGGNPWFAEALAQGADSATTVRDRVALRVAHLERATPGAGDLLHALAPAGEPLPHAVVATLAGGDSPRLRWNLSAARAAGVLIEQDGRWRFRHELLRRSLLDGMIDAERRERHRALAEALTRHEPPTSPALPVPRARRPPPPARRSRAAEIAMHFALTGDERAARWALAAADEARAVDAHEEALAQLERALDCAMEPEVRRVALALAAMETYTLGRFAESRLRAEEGLAIAGGEPEARAHLHWLAHRVAYRFDAAAADGHLAAAERLLDSRPAGADTARVALARLHERVRDPVRGEQAIDAVLSLLPALDPEDAGWVEFEALRFRVILALRRGDAGAFRTLEAMLALAGRHGLQPGFAVAALTEAYAGATVALFHAEGEALATRLQQIAEAHEIRWIPLIEPYRALWLTQRGRYAEARAAIEAATSGRLGGDPAARLAAVEAFLESRAGSPGRARAILRHAAGSSQGAADLLDLARLEIEGAAGADGAGAVAVEAYEQRVHSRHGRVAGAAAVAIAHAGMPPPAAPEWLPLEAPVRLFWEWAAAIARRDATALRQIAARFTALACPHEAALAQRDAGDLAAAYRALRDLGATPAREQTAALLRAAGQPVPRRSRAAVEADGLTETERLVVRLVVAGETNEGIALRLKIGTRTVEAHLTRLYEKTGSRGRAALTRWWTERERPDPG